MNVFERAIAELRRGGRSDAATVNQLILDLTEANTALNAIQVSLGYPAQSAMLNAMLRTISSEISKATK